MLQYNISNLQFWYIYCNSQFKLILIILRFYDYLVCKLLLLKLGKM